MSEDILHEDLQGTYVITILIRSESPVPDVDLGQIPIAEAILLFEEIADELRSMRVPPKISMDGEVIFDLGYGEDDDFDLDLFDEDDD